MKQWVDYLLAMNPYMSLCNRGHYLQLVRVSQYLSNTLNTICMVPTTSVVTPGVSLDVARLASGAASLPLATPPHTPPRRTCHGHGPASHVTPYAAAPPVPPWPALPPAPSFKEKRSCNSCLACIEILPCLKGHDVADAAPLPLPQQQPGLCHLCSDTLLTQVWTSAEYKYVCTHT